MHLVHTTSTMLLAGALILGTAGCAGNQSAGSGSNSTSMGSAPVEQEQQAEKTPAQLAAAAYKEVLSNPASQFQLDDSLSADATYSYALVNMNGEEIPQLLLRVTGSSEAWGGMETIHVLSYDVDSAALIAPAYDISAGVASAGGYRGSLMYSVYGNGLLRSEFSSGTGEGRTTRITLSGDTIAETFVSPIDMTSESAVTSLADDEGAEITWLDASDSSALDSLENGTWTSTVTNENPDMSAVAQNVGLSVYTGTVRVLDAQGVCDLQGQANPNPGSSDTSMYVVLDFGSEQQVTAHSSGDPDVYTNGSTLLLLYSGNDTSSWDALDGKQVTVAVDSNSAFWPSDTSLPLGAPRCTGSVAVIS